MGDDLLIVPTDSDGFMNLSDIRTAPSIKELPNMSLSKLQKMAIDSGIKRPGEGWSKCCPPTGNKLDIIKHIKQNVQHPSYGQSLQEFAASMGGHAIMINGETDYLINGESD